MKRAGCNLQLLTSNTISTLLSKSSFIRSLQCQKSLYLYKKHFNLRDVISQEQQAIFDRGHKVGFLAQELFPGGVDVGWDTPVQYRKSVSQTAQHIQNRTQVIYEAAFVWNDVLVAADILVKQANGWHVFEVKSSLSISETYLRDAALQYYIIGKSGLDINGISIIYLDKNYTRGPELDIKKLFTSENVTTHALEKMPDVIQGLIKARKTILSDRIPDISIGPHCDIPYTCDFKNHCRGKSIPELSVLDLMELEEASKWALFNQNIIDLNDIPVDYPLDDKQRIELNSLKTGTIYKDLAGIQTIIHEINEPSAVLDMQVFRAAVPVINRANPYKQIPFGFALLTKNTTEPDIYLSESIYEIEAQFLDKFLTEAEKYNSILVFDKKWELWALQNIAKAYPEFDSRIATILERILDVSIIFKSGFYFDPAINRNSMNFLHGLCAIVRL